MAKDKRIKVVLTGGHAATTAIATLEEILRRKNDWEVFWIGAKEAIEGRGVETLESQVFPKLGVKVYPIKAGRIQRRFTLFTIPSLLKIPFGFFHALTLLVKIRPSLVLSFGAYAAFPVVVAAWILGIPVVVHEQTIAAGRANRFSAFFAGKIALAREASRKFFPKNKCVVVGNPILTQIAEVGAKGSKGNPGTIFVTCGSRGSQMVNEAVGGILERILSKFTLIHQTGSLDFGKFKRKKNTLSSDLSKRYEVFERIDPMKIDDVYRQADIVVARAGANTVSEIIATRRPAILIPIPWSYLDEQNQNARFAEDLGIAKIIPQDSLTSEKLLKTIEEVWAGWEKMVAAASKKDSPDLKASQKLVDVLEGALG